MAKGKSARGYGSRYGRKIRNKLGRFLSLKQKAKECPYCAHTNVKRVAAGIWNCKKCAATFTGRAYDLAEVKIKEEVEE